MERQTDELEQLKNQILSIQDLSREEAEVNEMEMTISQTQDAATRAQLTQTQTYMKRALEHQKRLIATQVAQLQQRQMRIEQALQAENAKLADLQQQREKINREMESPTDAR